jgi:hypothetical protein
MPHIRRRDPEHDLQAAIVAWHEKCVPREAAELLAIPNGGHRRKSVAGKLKAEGQRKGATDLVLALPAGRVAWIEVKLEDTATTKRTDLSPAQRDFKAKILALGHQHRVVRSVEQYQAVLDELGVPHRARPVRGWAAPSQRSC